MSIGLRRPSSAGPRRLARPTEEGTAAGIYGLIVSGAVMAAAPRTPLATTAAVLTTLVIYWSAERYARLMAARIHEGHRPSWQHVRVQLTTGWEIVTASVLPLGVLLVLSLVGVSVNVAILAAMACTTLLLFLSGWEIGRSGHLSTRARIASACVAALFGVMLIVLKATLH
jgi:hypothetical protein